MDKRRQSFAEWLDQMLARRGIQPSQLAAYLEITDTAVHKWRHGKSVPGANACVKLARYFHVPVSRVLALAGHVPPEAEDIDLDSLDFREALRRQLGEDVGEEAVALIETLLRIREERDRERRERPSSGQ